MHNHREIKAASGEEKSCGTDVLFSNSWNLKISSSLDSHGDWLGEELVAYEWPGDHSATNQNYFRLQAGAGLQTLGCRRRAADAELQLLSERLQTVSLSSSVTKMLHVHVSASLSVFSSVFLFCVKLVLCCIQGYPDFQIYRLKSKRKNEANKKGKISMLSLWIWTCQSVSFFIYFLKLNILNLKKCEKIWVFF